jgi:hypothetical protein
MKGSIRLRGVVAGLCLAMLSGTACAGDAATYNLALPSSTAGPANDLQSYMLAANDAVATPEKANATSVAKPLATLEVRDPWFTADKLHEYLGLGTIVLAAATAATAPEGCETANCTPQTNGTHAKLGRATRAMALSAVATGLLFHWDDMHLFEDGLKDPDTQHWLLAGSGALLLANAVSRAPAHSHSGEAELGALMMLVAIKITW